jgi:hypothetical protein
VHSFRPRSDAPQHKILRQEEAGRRGERSIIKELERKVIKEKGNRKSLKNFSI